MARNSHKDTIHVLMNIDSYSGESQGRLAPMLIFLGVAAAPFLLYVFTLSRVLPLKIVLVFEVIWSAIWALEIFGHGNRKMPEYEAALKDDYATADDLVRIAFIHDDGLIEYMNGEVAYIVTGYFMSYTNDDGFSNDVEDFLNICGDYEYDVTLQLLADEYKLQNDMECMRVYTDKEMMKERMEFYIDQDDYSHDNVCAYKVNFVFRTLKYDWNGLHQKLIEIVNSEAADVFKDFKICNKEEVSEVVSRDIYTNINLYNLLVKKYKNDDFSGSKVLFYGEEVPEEYKPKKDRVSMEQRRVTNVVERSGRRSK